MFQNFSDIVFEKQDTWKGKKILTFDIDWASDEVLLYTIKLLEELNVKATFFITHNTDLLSRIRNNKNFELAIHPNFNKVLENESKKKVDEIFNEILEIVPEAKASRSHSLTNSGRWNSLYTKNNIHYTSNYFMYLKKGIEPIKNINNVIEVPIYFADDALLYLNFENDKDLPLPKLSSKNKNGIEVFLFHPIHIALNSNSLTLYNQTRKIHSNWKELEKVRNSKIGVKNILIDLIK